MTKGFLTIDHRATSEGLFEASTKTCQHCLRVGVWLPNEPGALHYCRKCDDYICDDCALVMKAGGEHRSFAQLSDEVREAVVRGRNITPTIGRV